MLEEWKRSIQQLAINCYCLLSTYIYQGGLISMDAQLDYFRTSLEGFTPRLCSTTRRVLLSMSIFLLSAASNDLLRFYMSNASKTHDAISKFISLASKYRSQILETLYSLGARRFAILGLGLNGCSPSMRFRTANGECIKHDYAVQFNVALGKVLEEFSSTHEGIKYSVGNMHNFGKMPFGDPLAYGFKESKSACCGEGRFNGEAGCTPNSTLCSNRQDYYYWDWFHPTDHAAKLQTWMLYGGPRTLASPINFGELVED